MSPGLPRGIAREDVICGVFAAAVCCLLGAPAGLVWAALAPHAHVTITSAGASVVDGATEIFIAADAWFLGVTVVVGLMVGVVAWLLARASGPAVVIGLTVGSVLGAYIAAKVGMRPGQDALRAAAVVGRRGRYAANVVLQTRQAVLGWPIAALVAFATLVGADRGAGQLGRRRGTERP